MNYLEIINKCLSELNFKTVSDFNQLDRPEHQKVKNYINLIAQEICRFENWSFLLRRETLTLAKGESQLENVINGRIMALYIDNYEYKFCEEFDNFLLNKKIHERIYSEFENKLLFSPFEEDKLVNIIYYTRNVAFNADGEEKEKLEFAEDTPLIPEYFVEQILVYGTCMRIKADPEHAKFAFWKSMYNSAISAMRSKIAVNAEYSPYIRLYRQ